MSKIVKIVDDIIYVGMDNGSIKEVRKADLNFEPTIGDELEVYETENNLIVTKKQEKKEMVRPDGININVNNSNNGSGSPIYVANNTKAVNKVVYCVLAFFFGGAGIHKFYAGKISSGILYILFFWTLIPAFIALIEFLSALFKKPDINGNILV